MVRERSADESKEPSKRAIRCVEGAGVSTNASGTRIPGGIIGSARVRVEHPSVPKGHARAENIGGNAGSRIDNRTPGIAQYLHQASAQTRSETGGSRKGQRLFGAIDNPVALRLVNSIDFTGAVAHVYQPA